MPQERYKVLSLPVIALAITASLAVMSMSSPTRANTATSATNTLTVSGSGLATGAPDTYTVSFSVEGVDANASAAMQKANGVYNSFVSALDQDGHNTTLLTLSSLDVYPEYYYPNDGPAVFQDYRVVFSLQYKETVADPTPFISRHEGGRGHRGSGAGRGEQHLWGQLLPERRRGFNAKEPSACPRRC